MSGEEKHLRTIKHLADSPGGVAAWAVMCMEFEQSIPAGNVYSRHVSVMQRIALD